MPFLSDYAYHFAPWPPIALGMGLNSVVHIVMYSYYAMTAFVTLHDFSWKRRITQLQFFQFAIGVVYGTYGYLYEGYCVFSFLYPLALIGFFGNYYYQAFFKTKDH
jgi:elongation of very long chain fatty acids protein 4